MSNVEIWERIAPFWGRGIGAPTTNPSLDGAERLLAARPREVILEIGCGAGLLSRRLADSGATVIATDAVQPFLDLAVMNAPGVELRKVDATREQDLLSLGDSRFDAAVATMVLMNLPTMDPLFAALPRLLKPGGRFVFTVVHPCFTGGFAVPAERRRGPLARAERIANELIRRRLLPRAAVTASARLVEPWFSARTRARYLVPEGRLGIFVLGQPEPHWNYHRPLGALLGPALAAGFLLDALEEPPNPDGSGLPGILAARLRLPTA